MRYCECLGERMDEVCTQHVNTIERLKDIAAWERALQEERAAKKKE